MRSLPLEVSSQWRPLAFHAPRVRTSVAWCHLGESLPTKSSTKPKATSRPRLPSLAEDSMLEAGDSTADPEILLKRNTPTGLTEHELLLALNSHDEDDLQKFSGFGPRVAQKIIAFRSVEKFFSSLDELVRVPLIGPTRFRKLVGRESLFYTLALHSTLRRPAPADLKFGDLRPLNWPAPAVPRVFLGRPEDEVSEQELSEQNSWFLHTRRIGRYILFIHSNTHMVAGWAEHLIRALPRTLRRILHSS